MNQITVKIDGMMCGMCESHVNEAIRQAFPVKKVMSSHSKGETVILTEVLMTQEQLQAALAAMGYQVLDLTAVPYQKKSFLGFLKK